MNGKLMLYLDQFGNYFYAENRQELQEGWKQREQNRKNVC